MAEAWPEMPVCEHFFLLRVEAMVCAGARSSRRGRTPAAGTLKHQYIVYLEGSDRDRNLPFESIDEINGSWEIMSDNERKANECVIEESLMLDAILSKKKTVQQ